jgi:2-polyprenyl-3-methyl-5-hydroxy-6-metoxy-1,4-benzoquinol methylase
MKTSKPRVAFLVDKHGWAYDFVAQSLMKCLSDKYDFTLYYVSDDPKITPDSFDLLHVFFWGEDYHQQFDIDPKFVIKEVASHRWALEEEYGKLSIDEFVKKHLLHCAAITTPSMRLFQMLNGKRSEIFYCPNGIDPKLFKVTKRAKGRLKVGWAGNPSDLSKGLHDILIPACEGLFHFSYTNGKLSQTNVANFYQKIDVIAIASTAEGQPLPLIEAMACGCFPVCTDVGIVPEMINSGYNGLIVERSVDAFRQAFHWCNKNLGAIRRVGFYNAQLCAVNRSWEVVAGNYASVFEFVLGKQEGRKVVTPRAPHTEIRAYNLPDASSVKTVTTTQEDQDYSSHFSAINPNYHTDEKYLASEGYYEVELLPLLPADRSSKIVDIGTGCGHLLRYLLERGYKYVGGVDICADLVRAAQTYLGDSPIFLSCMDAIEFLAAHHCEFDVIVAFDVIEHFHSDKAPDFVRKTLSALKPRGRLIVRTPNMANIFACYSRHIDLTHQHGFTEFSLFQLFRMAGYEEPQLHLPRLPGRLKARVTKRLSKWIQRNLLKWEDRTMPKCLDKNLVVWAEKKIIT